MSYSKLSFICQELEHRKSTHQFRQLQNVHALSAGKISVNGRVMDNFCSNDYLGLSRHPLIQERSIQFMELYGNGATASRLVCGNSVCYDRVERKLSTLKGSQAALILNSGFQLNVSILPALADRHSLIIADKLCHNSLVQGSVLSRCKFLRYRHNDLEHLRQLLEKSGGQKYSRIFIVTESVFSMDGDCSDIPLLKQLSEQYNAILLIDEAHATGVFGVQGMGLASGMDIDLVMGTFGKACGSFGAYICCSKEIADYLINCCAGLIYSTALPPSVLGAIDASLDLLPGMGQERTYLVEMAGYLRTKLHELGFNTGKSSSQIIPILIGSEEETLKLSEWLLAHSILASAIRPPTVEKGKARIRLTLSALHTKEQIDGLIHVLGKWQQKD